MPNEPKPPANPQSGPTAITEPNTPKNQATTPSPNLAKHGLGAALRVYPGENQQEFDELIAQYYRAFAPANAYQEYLVEEMAHSQWRIARFHRLENALLNQMTDPAAVVAPLGKLLSQAAEAERTCHRALRQLKALQKFDAECAARPSVQNEPNSRPPERTVPNEPKTAPPAPGNPFDTGGWKM